MKPKRQVLWRALIVCLAAIALVAAPTAPAQAYNPMGGVLYDLGDRDCLKGLGNCAVYPKATQLPGGRLVAAFENAVVAQSGSADGETLPIYKSDDDGTSWQHLAEVPAPAYLSSDPAYDRYISHWGSPYLYALPQQVGNLSSGTLLLASIVTGDDHYFLERKAADPNWVPNNDGDRSDMALALYASSDQGTTWRVVNIIATGGWQGGSAGATGVNVAAANTYRQVDPVWEPFLMVYNGQLVAYYSDENDYTGVTSAGVPILDPANATATDSQGQILVHKTWNGTSANWSSPVVDVQGLTQNMGNGKTEIGGGRPGMTTIAPTSDGRWLLTYEYWGGGSNIRYKIANSPLDFRNTGGQAGSEISGLPVSSGSRSLSTGGSPVLIGLPDGRIVYNAAGSGSVWVNETGSSTGTWTEYQTNIGAGYSRTVQYVEDTGRVVILQGTWGGPTSAAIIRFGEVDLGDSEGAYHQLVNRQTGQVLGTGGNVTDANIGNGDVPDVVLEDAGATAVPDTQFWHLATKGGDSVTLLNKSGGRAAGIWTGSATAGQRIGSWVDDTGTGTWNLVATSGGYYRLQSTANTSLYLTGGAEGAAATLQPLNSNGSQEWRLDDGLAAGAVNLTARHSGDCVDVFNASTANGAEIAQYTCNGGANQSWEFQALGNGYHQIVARHSGKCLDVLSASTADSARVVQWTCTGGANQQWEVQDAGAYVRLVARHSGKCLDVPSSSLVDGTRLQQYACNGGQNQQFGWSAI
ncbi:RICIN domain-containing protein [Glycomyces rhizosphaerae]|uniref:RICIN domain-containing protein n=1 Tax=Glycomyces rhizosphaerae TaxID=2054422 RepID=A0ABV7PYX6_9ACTN